MAYRWNPLDPEEARAQIAVPTFMVKTVSDVSTQGLLACHLVRTEITDVTVKQAWTGPARLQLLHHAMAPMAPMADLPVLEVLSASHVLTDLTLAPVRPVHDYLEVRAQER